MCAFIIAMFCNDFQQGQAVAKSEDLIRVCLSQALFPDAENPLLRQWSCLCLSMLWKNYPEAKWLGIRCAAHIKLCKAIVDPVPEVRAALLHALANFIGIPELTEQVAHIEESIASSLLAMSNEGSNLVRKELAIFFSVFVIRHENKFMVAAFENILNERSNSLPEANGRNMSSTPPSIASEDDSVDVSADSVHAAIWKQLLIMSVDPDPEVARDTKNIVDRVISALLKSPLGSHVQTHISDLLTVSQQPMHTNPCQLENQRPALPSVRPPTPSSPSPDKTDGYFSSSMKRTASVAASLRSLAFGSDKPAPESHKRTPSTGISRAPSVLTPMEPEDGRASKLSGPYDMTKVPLPKYFRPRSSQDKVKLPLVSTFFDFSMEYFREPQMKRSENDEPGSQVYNNRLWRQNRNEKILESTQRLKEQAGSSRWDENSGIFDNGVQPMQMCFHQFNNHLVVTDDHDTVRWVHMWVACH